MNMFKILKARWSAETPQFFKTLMKYAFVVGSIGLSLVPFVSLLPAIVASVPGYMIAIGAAATIIAKLTAVTDPALVEKSNEFLNQNKS